MCHPHCPHVPGPWLQKCVSAAPLAKQAQRGVHRGAWAGALPLPQPVLQLSAHDHRLPGGYTPRSLAVWLAVDHSGPQFPHLYRGAMTAFLSSEVLRGLVGGCLQALWVAPVCTTGWVRAALSSRPDNAGHFPEHRPSFRACPWEVNRICQGRRCFLQNKGKPGSQRGRWAASFVLFMPGPEPPKPVGTQAQIRVFIHSAQLLSTTEGSPRGNAAQQGRQILDRQTRSVSGPRGAEIQRRRDLTGRRPLLSALGPSLWPAIVHSPAATTTARPGPGPRRTAPLGAHSLEGERAGDQIFVMQPQGKGGRGL